MYLACEKILKVKYLIFIACLFCLSTVQQAGASHVLGGEFEWEHIAGDTFIITARLYRDCNNMPLAAGDIIIKTSCGNPSLKTKLNYKGDITPLCDTMQGRCVDPKSTFGYGIGFYELKTVFVATDLISKGCCLGKVVFEQCCRSNAITTGAASSYFYLESEMNFCEAVSSPKWHRPPIFISCVGVDARLDNGLSYEQTIDSVRYMLGEPKTGATTSISYNGGFGSNKPLRFLSYPIDSMPPPRGFHHDSLTGITTFRPMAVEHAVLGFKTELYHKGKYLGYLFREQQFIIIKCVGTSPPVLSGLNNGAYYSAIICAGHISCFNISAQAPAGDTVKLTYVDGWKNAVVNVANSGSAIDTATLCFTPGFDEIRKKPYEFVFAAKNNNCPIPKRDLQVYRITVVDTQKRAYSLHIDTLNACGGYRLQVKEKNNSRVNTVLWYVNDTLLSQTGPQIIWQAGYTGLQQIKAVVNDCGTAVLRAKMDVKNTNNLHFKLNDTTICGYSHTVFEPLISGAHGKPVYQWQVASAFNYSGKTDSTAIELNLQAIHGFSGLITLTVSDSIGCKLHKYAKVIALKYYTQNYESSRKICGENPPLISLKTANGGSWEGPQIIQGNTLVTKGLRGKLNYHYTELNSSYCIIDTLTITAKKTPVVDAGKNIGACIYGPEIQLEGKPEGGKWTGTAINKKNVFDADKAGLGPHLLIYSYTDSNSGCTGVDTNFAQVFYYTPKVKITDYTKACKSEPKIVIKAEPKGGVWSGKKINSDKSPLTLNPRNFDAGSYEIIYSYMDSNHCSSTDTTVLELLEAPKSDFNLPTKFTKPGDVLRITNATVPLNGPQYEWFIGNPPFATAQSTNFSQKIDSAGRFDIMLLATNTATGCTDTTIMSEGAVMLGTNSEQLAQKVAIYPNPANDLLFIDLPENQSVAAELSTLSGAVWLKTMLNSKINTISTSQLPAGTYLLHLHNQAFSAVYRIVIE
ncbi:T9SS type A sorting domain-containing protein [bacterium]|nr:T9SS type A sorting domain-containing protein [bacterium]